MADVIGHLRAISAQQSRIRGLRNKLAILREAAAKQDGATRELLLVRRIPAVYRQCLAECMRRCALREPAAPVTPRPLVGTLFAAVDEMEGRRASSATGASTIMSWCCLALGCGEGCEMGMGLSVLAWCMVAEIACCDWEKKD